MNRNGGRVTVTKPDGSVTTFANSRTFKSAARGNYAPEKYSKYLHSIEWKTRRDKHLKQYPKCKACGKEATMVHHRDYETAWNGKEKTRHLVSLCNRCHIFVHNHIKKTKKNLWNGTNSAISTIQNKMKK